MSLEVSVDCRTSGVNVAISCRCRGYDTLLVYIFAFRCCSVESILVLGIPSSVEAFRNGREPSFHSLCAIDHRQC